MGLYEWRGWVIFLMEEKKIRLLFTLDGRKQADRKHFSWRVCQEN